jgi:hypothetical protein
LDSLDFCFFVPVLNSFQYQDKEVKTTSQMNQENDFNNSVPEISGIHMDDRQPCPEFTNETSLLSAKEAVIPKTLGCI